MRLPQRGVSEEMMSKGIWVVLEGPDGAGKSTTMIAVADALRKKLPDVEIITTKHPGSTKLGQHIRELVKHPEKFGVDIDPLSSQMLMFTDHINFKTTVLEPAITRGAIVLADRCDLISGLVYGEATGLNLKQVGMLMNLACVPRIDMLYILRCSDDVQEQRLADREASDRFEVKTLRNKVNEAYSKLLTGPAERTIMIGKIVALENVQFLDTAAQLSAITDKLVKDISARYADSISD